MTDKQKDAPVAAEASPKIVVTNYKTVENLVNNLGEKLKEARELARELESTNIYVNDHRRKEINEYITELRKDFIKSFGYEPLGFHLVAEGRNVEIRISLH